MDAVPGVLHSHTYKQVNWFLAGLSQHVYNIYVTTGHNKCSAKSNSYEFKMLVYIKWCGILLIALDMYYAINKAGLHACRGLCKLHFPSRWEKWKMLPKGFREKSLQTEHKFFVQFKLSLCFLSLNQKLRCYAAWTSSFHLLLFVALSRNNWHAIFLKPCWQLEYSISD